MTSAIVPRPAAYDPGVVDTGAQRVLELSESGLTQTEIAAELHIAQSTVSRRLREAREQRADRLRRLARLAVMVLLTICLIILTAAVATIAWA